jgi:UDP-N-acetylmuramyl-tripeptide synthetase
MRLDALAKQDGADPRWRGLVQLATPQHAGVRICDFAEDSRTVVPGSLFVARAGRRADGRAFIEQAVRDGAAAILTDSESASRVPNSVGCLTSDDVPLAAGLIAERFYGEPSSKLFVIGVTGTNGKTTVAHLVHQLLNAAGVRCGLIGTIMIDNGRGLARSDMTTPACGETSQALASMVDSGCTHCVTEVSSHALDQKRVDGVRFDAAVFTNLSGDHLDYHGSMEAYAAAKARLFALLRPDGLAIVNGDDAFVETMLAPCNANAVRTGAGDVESASGTSGVGPDGWVEAIGEPGMAGRSVRYAGPFFERIEQSPTRREASFRLLGSFNRHNLAQAAIAAHAAGVGFHDIVHATARLSAPEGRLQRVEPSSSSIAASADVTVFVDFAHTDDALRRSLDAVRPVVPPSGRLVVVFGCGGDRDTTKRPRMGAVAVELADRVIITSDNPRTERPSDIVTDILEGVPREHRQHIDVHVDRDRAIDAAIRTAKSNDVIVIAGKGHEREQIVLDTLGTLRRLPFDDAHHARRALDARLTQHASDARRATTPPGCSTSAVDAGAVAAAGKAKAAP